MKSKKQPEKNTPKWVSAVVGQFNADDLFCKWYSIGIEKITENTIDDKWLNDFRDRLEENGVPVDILDYEELGFLQIHFLHIDTYIDTDQYVEGVLSALNCR